MIAGVPSEVTIPAVAVELAAGEPIEPVWLNELGGLTFKLGTARYLKWAPPGVHLDLATEAKRLNWAGRWITVPVVLAQGPNWLLTEAIPGTMAVADEWKLHPHEAVVGLARGLRRLHDRLPVDHCPFSWQAADRLARLENPGPELTRTPPVERLVVCHGDPCAPNTLLFDDGQPAGYVDLGRLGLADRWADLAVATWSLEWNFGPGWDELFLAEYGVRPDPLRTAYYRQLWDAAD